MPAGEVRPQVSGGAGAGAHMTVRGKAGAIKAENTPGLTWNGLVVIPKVPPWIVPPLSTAAPGVVILIAAWVLLRIKPLLSTVSVPAFDTIAGPLAVIWPPTSLLTIKPW